MHERTQRAISRLLFVFCCALPTAFTLLCVIVTWTPWFHYRALRQLENDISLASGMIVRIEAFHRTSPSTVHLSNVRILNPETLREVASVREVDWDDGQREVKILMHQPTLQSRQLESAWKLVHDRFLCDPERTEIPVRFAANDLTIESQGAAMTFRDVGARLRPNGNSIEAIVQGLTANDVSGQPITVSVSRLRDIEPPLTRWMLDSGATPLPCSAIAEYLPTMKRLGPDAEFLGKMRWQSNSKNSLVDLGGSQFRNVALDRVFEDQSHRFSGLATIDFAHCHINPSERRSDIVGTIRIKNGQIGRSLLRSAKQHFGFQVGVPAGDGDVPFDSISIGFNINNTELSLDGICHSEPGQEGVGDDVVMCIDGNAVVHSTATQLNAIDAITVIAPDHVVPVPMSGQTEWLANVLIPPSRPKSYDENRIRSAMRYEGGPLIEQPEPGMHR